MTTLSFSIQPLTKFIPGIHLPLGLTHGIYVAGPGIFESEAVAFCHSEHVARLLCDLLNEADLQARQLFPLDGSGSIRVESGHTGLE